MSSNKTTRRVNDDTKVDNEDQLLNTRENLKQQSHIDDNRDTTKHNNKNKHNKNIQREDHVDQKEGELQRSKHDKKDDTETVDTKKTTKQQNKHDKKTTDTTDVDCCTPAGIIKTRFPNGIACSSYPNTAGPSRCLIEHNRTFYDQSCVNTLKPKWYSSGDHEKASCWIQGRVMTRCPDTGRFIWKNTPVHDPNYRFVQENLTVPCDLTPNERVQKMLKRTE